MPVSFLNDAGVLHDWSMLDDAFLKVGIHFDLLYDITARRSESVQAVGTRVAVIHYSRMSYSSSTEEAEESMHLESPPRHFGDEDTASDGGVMLTSTAAASPRQVDHRPAPLVLLSTPVRNSIARVKDRRDDPYFDREETIDGVPNLFYKEMGPFTTDVTVEEVNEVISVSEGGITWVTAENEGPHRRSNAFRKWILPLLPPHLALAFDQPILFGFSNSSDGRKKQGGRQRLSPFLVGMRGKCSAKIHGCPSVFACGFTEKSIKKLLSDPCPKTISLHMEVQNACIHVKGQTYGQLRGPVRDEVVQDFISSGQQPAEYAKAALQKATDSEFNSHNLGAVVTKAGAQNISREAKENKMMTSGLTKCKLTNLMLACDITNKRDIESRRRIDDSQEDCQGIVRSVALFPAFRLVLYTKPCVQLFQHLVRGGRLIINCDATGNLLNFPMVERLKDKILHTKLTAHPKYPVIDGQYTLDKQVSRIMSPLTLAEMVSNKNAADDYEDFFRGFLTSVREAFPEEATEQPLICMTDCSPQLQSGMLRTFSSGEGKARTRIEYGNTVLLHLLYYDKALSDISAGIETTTSQRDLALDVLASLRHTVGIYLKECSSHVCRAPFHWVRNQKDNEIANAKSRFEQLLKSVFYKVTREPKISVAIVQFCLVVAMLETEKFNSGSFEETMPTKEFSGPLEKAAEDRMLSDVDSFIRTESEKLHIQSLKDVKDKLELPAVKKKHITLHIDIIERAKAFMRGQCRTYLRHVSDSNDYPTQKMGVVRCSITYGRSLVIESGNEEMEPWFQGGFDLSLQLPHNGEGGITNPLYSVTLAKYLRKTWMNKFSFWCRGIINLVEAGMQMQIEANNQSLEAIFKNVKHNTDVYNNVSEPGEYIIHRYDDIECCTRQFVHQYESIEGRIKEMMRRRERLSSASSFHSDNAVAGMAPATATLPATQDEVTQETEDSLTEQWSRSGSASEIEAKLRNELVEIFVENISTVGGTSMKRKHGYLEACVGTKRISYPTFRQFMNDKQKNMQKSASGLKITHRQLLEEFVVSEKKKKPDSPAPVAS